MSDYRRLYIPGGCYFFTAVTWERQQLFSAPEHVERLRMALRYAISKRPFWIEAMVVLPDHLHCVWRLPEDDGDFSTRWKILKRYFSTGIVAPITVQGEKMVWQRRFWEHLIRDETDWQRHLDYIHYNPVKHGFVRCPEDWPYSSLKRWQERGFYPVGWGHSEPDTVNGLSYE